MSSYRLVSFTPARGPPSSGRRRDTARASTAPPSAAPGFAAAAMAGNHASFAAPPVAQAAQATGGMSIYCGANIFLA